MRSLSPGDLIAHPRALPDADSLGERLRAIDKLEVLAASGLQPAEGIVASIKASRKWWVGTIDGKDECVWGVTPLPGMDRWAAPWMHCTPKVFRGLALSTFVRRSREFVDSLAEGTDVLVNIIAEDNHASRRWLRFAGFSIKEYPTHVIHGLTSLEFIRVTPGGHYDPDTF